MHGAQLCLHLTKCCNYNFNMVKTKHSEHSVLKSTAKKLRSDIGGRQENGITQNLIQQSRGRHGRGRQQKTQLDARYWDGLVGKSESQASRHLEFGSLEPM